MSEKVRKGRYLIFLKDVFILALSAFGGPQAHIAMLFERMVEKRGYLTEDELLELNALCNLLPGPTSTQTLTAIGYKYGGPNLAYLTLLVWILPAGSIMIVLGIFVSTLHEYGMSLDFARYIQPMAVGFIFYASYKIGSKVLSTKTGVTLGLFSAGIAFYVSSNFGEEKIASLAYPILLIMGGLLSALKYKRQPRQRKKEKLNIQWGNFILFIVVFVVAVVMTYTSTNRLFNIFENFYRDGSLIFGGGQVLIPLLKAEFVDLYQWLDVDEFLSGFGFVQAVPGPVFSFSGYIGAVSMSEYGISASIWGGLVALAGVFLPGTFLIFFVIRFWSGLKQYRVVRASIEGVSAVGVGLVTAAAFLLSKPMNTSIYESIGLTNIGIILVTIGLLHSKKVPAPIIVVIGVVAGIISTYL